jgi:tetratricopeptide (TPR) repeat protein
MKKIFILVVSLCCIGSLAAPSGAGIYQKQLAEALERVRSGKYIQAAPLLFQLSRRNELANEQMQIKYILGLSLMELKMYQVASFQFVEVIKQGNSKYVKLAVQKLAAIADYLGDDTILNYALNKVELSDFPENQKDMLYFRLGEIKAKSGENDQAIQYFDRVPVNSSFYHQALYKKGLALAEQNKTKEIKAVTRKVSRTPDFSRLFNSFSKTAMDSIVLFCSARASPFLYKA